MFKIFLIPQIKYGNPKGNSVFQQDLPYYAELTVWLYCRCKW